MPNLISQTVTQVVTSLHNAVMATTHFIQTGADKVYNAIAGLFASGRPAVSHKPLTLEQQMLRALKNPRDNEISLNAAPAGRLQLTAPAEEAFRDAKTDAAEARLKWEIAGKITDLLQGLNATTAIQRKSVDNFARIIRLLREHGLNERNSRDLRFGHRLINIIMPKISAAMHNDSTAQVQNAILSWLENDVMSLEGVTWEDREIDLLKARNEDSLEALLAQEIKTTITSTDESQRVVLEEDSFLDAKTGEKEASRKREIAEKAANLFNASNIDGDLKQRSEEVLAKINALLRKHGLSERNSQGGNFGTTLENIIFRDSSDLMSDDADLQDMVMEHMEGDIINLIEQQTWLVP